MKRAFYCFGSNPAFTHLVLIITGLPFFAVYIQCGFTHLPEFRSVCLYVKQWKRMRLKTPPSPRWHSYSTVILLSYFLLQLPTPWADLNYKETLKSGLYVCPFGHESGNTHTDDVKTVTPVTEAGCNYGNAKGWLIHVIDQYSEICSWSYQTEWTLSIFPQLCSIIRVNFPDKTNDVVKMLNVHMLQVIGKLWIDKSDLWPFFLFAVYRRVPVDEVYSKAQPWPATPTPGEKL